MQKKINFCLDLKKTCQLIVKTKQRKKVKNVCQQEMQYISKKNNIQLTQKNVQLVRNNCALSTRLTGENKNFVRLFKVL